MKLVKVTAKLFSGEIEGIALPVVVAGAFVVETHEVDIALPKDETTAINVTSNHGVPIKLELRRTDTGIEIFYDDAEQYWRIESIEVLG